ncbi:hypothetical protein ANN_15991 [Periplaneta americana]|uniref:Mos1 transposase HTH domain-containing protein n=1 Tax=Periplaneta americana TaxID=6978 RepID=A0ABQ8SJP1_PERAM|nr:hypothetical protein ANN_15991 [Periplaneta americana]
MAGLCEGGNEPPGSLKASKMGMVQHQCDMAPGEALYRAFPDQEKEENTFKDIKVDKLSVVCGETIMSDGMVRKWVRQFKEGRENVHDEPWSGRPSVVTDDLLQVVEAKLRRTDVSQYRCFLRIFHKFQDQSSTTLGQNA